MTNHCIVRLGRAAVLVGIVTLCLAAPSAWAQKSAEKATEDREAFRGSVLVIRGQIDATLNALDGIVKGKDGGARKKALKNYSEEIKEMDKQIEKTRDYAEKMKERGQAYFKEWEKTMKSVTNEALKASANERRAALQSQYEKIESSIAQAKQDSSTFWKNLQDLQKYFENDLSADAVAASGELVATTNSDGKKIQGYIDEVVAAVDEVGAQMKKQAEGE